MEPQSELGEFGTGRQAQSVSPKEKGGWRDTRTGRNDRKPTRHADFVKSGRSPSGRGRGGGGGGGGFRKQRQADGVDESLHLLPLSFAQMAPDGPVEWVDWRSSVAFVHWRPNPLLVGLVDPSCMKRFPAKVERDSDEADAPGAKCIELPSDESIESQAKAVGEAVRDDSADCDSGFGGDVTAAADQVECQLSEEIASFYETARQKPFTIFIKMYLRDLLYAHIRLIFPTAGLYIVGSTWTGFAFDGSDMDLCLLLFDADIDQRTDAVQILKSLVGLLATLEPKCHQQLILAKVPILRLRFVYPFHRITVDVNANNRVSLRNTHLLRGYCSLDERVPQLVVVVKQWARRHGLNDPVRSTLSSYSLVLMVIHYLQHTSVVPSLQETRRAEFGSDGDVRLLFTGQPPPVADATPPGDATPVSDLLLGFLHYFAFKFDFESDAVSVRRGGTMPRAEAAQRRTAQNSPSQWRCVAIEEPFTLTNTAHAVYDELAFASVKRAFAEGHARLAKSGKLDDLLK